MVRTPYTMRFVSPTDICKFMFKGQSPLRSERMHMSGYEFESQVGNTISRIFPATVNVRGACLEHGRIALKCRVICRPLKMRGECDMITRNDSLIALVRMGLLWCKKNSLRHLLANPLRTAVVEVKCIDADSDIHPDYIRFINYQLRIYKLCVEHMLVKENRQDNTVDTFVLALSVLDNRYVYRLIYVNTEALAVDFEDTCRAVIIEKQ